LSAVQPLLLSLLLLLLAALRATSGNGNVRRHDADVNTNQAFSAKERMLGRLSSGCGIDRYLRLQEGLHGLVEANSIKDERAKAGRCRLINTSVGAALVSFTHNPRDVHTQQSTRCAVYILLLQAETLYFWYLMTLRCSCSISTLHLCG
jgi:hypothetical protein